MLFCARKFLHLRSEVEFWKMRPRTYFALLTIAIEYKNGSTEGGAVNSQSASGLTTIDNIPGF